MKSAAKIILIVVLIASTNGLADGIKKEYTPGGSKYSSVWKRFYAGDHEPELDDPLIGAGKGMTLVICEAIKNEDMKYRRYAIGALGYIGDRRSLPTLEQILKSQNELDYFRGDALHSIFQIDKELGRRYSLKYGNESNYLKLIHNSIMKNEKWLTEPTDE